MARVMLGASSNHFHEAKGECVVEQRTWERIEGSRRRWDVLNHPFYKRWTAGELTAEERAAGEALLDRLLGDQQAKSA